MLASTRRMTRVGWYTVAAALVALAATPAAVATDTVCDGTTADAAGYVCGTTGAWTIPNPSTTVTWGSKGCDLTYPAGDECSASRTLAAGGFRWYGTTYTSVNIGSNGYVSFSSSARATAADVSIPDLAAPSATIYAYGDDLWIDTADTPTTLVKFDNNLACDVGAGNQSCAVVRWSGAAVLDVNGAEVGRATVKLALVYATGRAYVVVESETDSDTNVSHPRAVGTENADSSVGLWFKGAGDQESSDAGAGSQFVFGLEADTPSVTVGSERPLDDATAVPLAATVQVTFDEPMNTGSVALTVLAGTDPGGWSKTWSNGNRTVVFAHNALSHTTAYQLQVTGSDVAGNAVEVNNLAGAGSCAGFCWNFATVDLTAPSNVTKITNTSTDLDATLEYKVPAGDFAGVLVLRQQNSPVTDAPANGVSYNVADQIGTSDVVCKAPAPATSCVDPSVLAGATYYYKTFAYDAALNYSSGATVMGTPKSVSIAKWSINVNVASLNPPWVSGAATTSAIGTVGNDRLAHRWAPNGLRGAWDPPVLGGAINSRGAVGDLNPGGAPSEQGFFSGQNGYLYKVDMTTGQVNSLNVAATGGIAGCTAGLLQASPNVMFEAYDVGGTANDDAVLVGTRCSGTTSKALVSGFDLTPRDLWPDTEDAGYGYTMGPMNAQPLIVYKDNANNLVFFATREGGTHTLFGLEVDSGGLFPDGQPPWSVDDVGGVDANPILVRRAGEQWLAVGNVFGQLHVFNPLQKVGNGLSPIDELGTPGNLPAAAGDGPVKGLAATANVGGTNWVVWTTDSKIHGVRFEPGGDFDEASYWERAFTGSAPLLLTGFTTAPQHRVFVGGNDGRLYTFDATNVAAPTSIVVQSGTTLGEPSFDYNDGSNQGIVVGSTAGTIHWVPLSDEN